MLLKSSSQAGFLQLQGINVHIINIDASSIILKSTNIYIQLPEYTNID